jgi:hypothetical protein
MVIQTCTIRQFDVVSVAKFFSVLGVLWGFLMGVFVAAGIGGMGYMMRTAGLGFGAGIATLLGMVVIGAVAGFIGGAIIALVYNVVAGASGGVKMELEGEE